jgi:hypothetical protein
VVRDPNLNPSDFSTLLYLKLLSFYNSAMSFEVDPKKLSLKLKMDDIRTLKKCIESLISNGYLLEGVEFKRKSPISIRLSNEKLHQNPPFTQLPATVFEFIETINYFGVRLLYYYESYINRNGIHKQYCYPSIETIVKETGITKNTVTKYNDILVKNKLLKIEKHKLGTEYKYDEQDNLIFDRFNNHYYVRIENLKKEKEATTG